MARSVVVASEFTPGLHRAGSNSMRGDGRLPDASFEHHPSSSRSLLLVTDGQGIPRHELRFSKHGNGPDAKSPDRCSTSLHRFRIIPKRTELAADVAIRIRPLTFALPPEDHVQVFIDRTPQNVLLGCPPPTLVDHASVLPKHTSSGREDCDERASVPCHPERAECQETSQRGPGASSRPCHCTLASASSGPATDLHRSSSAASRSRVPTAPRCSLGSASNPPSLATLCSFPGTASRPILCTTVRARGSTRSLAA